MAARGCFRGPIKVGCATEDESAASEGETHLGAADCNILRVLKNRPAALGDGALSSCEIAAGALFEAGLDSQATLRAYGSDFRAFEAWCAAQANFQACGVRDRDWEQRVAELAPRLRHLHVARRIAAAAHWQRQT